MKTVELRSLVSGTDKVIPIPKEIEEAYNIWKTKDVAYRLKHNVKESTSPLEIFYAGYILSNPTVRELYKRSVQ